MGIRRICAHGAVASLCFVLAVGLYTALAQPAKPAPSTMTPPQGALRVGMTPGARASGRPVGESGGQRVSRLVRETLSFSKKLANHIGAIKYFICHYNLEKAVALPV